MSLLARCDAEARATREVLSENGLDGELGSADGLASFGLRKGQDVAEHDLMHVNNGMLFWGVRNVDGRGFETLENRPTNLQISMVRR